MRIKNSLNDLIGKIVNGIVIAEYAEGNPTNRIFLTFSDGSAFEIWQDDNIISMASDPNTGDVEQLVQLLKRREGAEVRAFRPRHEDPSDPQHDLLTDRS
jgi:hypothetical protein